VIEVQLLISESVGADYLGPDGIKRFFTDIEDAGPDKRIRIFFDRDKATKAVGLA
jgi:hypothetical protein